MGKKVAKNKVLFLAIKKFNRRSGLYPNDEMLNKMGLNRRGFHYLLSSKRPLTLIEGIVISEWLEVDPSELQSYEETGNTVHS